MCSRVDASKAAASRLPAIELNDSPVKYMLLSLDERRARSWVSGGEGLDEVAMIVLGTYSGR